MAKAKDLLNRLFEFVTIDVNKPDTIRPREEGDDVILAENPHTTFTTQIEFKDPEGGHHYGIYSTTDLQRHGLTRGASVKQIKAKLLEEGYELVGTGGTDMQWKNAEASYDDLVALAKPVRELEALSTSSLYDDSGTVETLAAQRGQTTEQIRQEKANINWATSQEMQEAWENSDFDRYYELQSRLS